MAGLPKFVRDQMARTPVPSSHPDSDILTAFAENMLTTKERQQVVEHLSACTECREIVFLARPDAVATQTVLAPKPRRYSWMAWASVAAVVVVVASAVILQHEQVTETQPPVTVATTTTPAQPEAKATASPTTNSKEGPPPAIKTRTEALQRDMVLDARKTKPAAEPLLESKGVEASQQVYLKTPVPPAAANQQVAVAGAAPQQAPTGPEQRNIAGQIQQAQGPSNTANISATSANLAKAESAAPAKIAKKQRADAFHGLATGYTAAPAAVPPPAARAHWQISSTGTLERSYDADNWSAVLIETGAKFHVVSVIGNTVWAGGEYGALYVSRDGGATWTPITIDTTATIASVHFSNDSHGTLETSDGQVWKTADSGKTWQKQ